MKAQAQSRWWVVTALLAAVIWWLSSRSDPIGVPLPHPVDWLAHTFSYALLGYAAARASGSGRVAWVLGAWFGAVDEVHQAFVAGREAGIGDWWFDVLGSYVGSRAGRQRAAQVTE